MDMRNSPHAGTVRGVSIAIIVFAVITIVGGVIALVSAPFAGIWEIIVGVILLLGGLKGKDCTDDSRKLDSARTWAIVGIVFSVIGGGLIEFILYIVLLVNINSMKSEAAAAYGNPYSQQPNYGNGAQQGYQQPSYKGTSAQQPGADPNDPTQR